MSFKIRAFVKYLCKGRQFFCLLFISFAACTTPSSAKVNYRPDVFFSGIAYLGNYSHIEQNYPYAMRLNRLKNTVANDVQPSLLDRHFIESIKGIKPLNFNMQFGLADLRKGQSIAMALALESESVSTEVIGDKRKVIVEAAAQLFFFDYASMTLLANVPLNIAKNHVLQKDLNYLAHLPPLFKSLYLGNSGLLAQAADLIKTTSLDLANTIRFQLVQVSTSSKVQGFLPASLTTQRFNQFVGQYFSSRLANKYQIAVLPFTKGYAVGNQMAGRFANGNVFNLTLPVPDYTFTIEIADLKKAPFKGNLMYASRIGMSFTQKVSNTVYFDDLFQYAVPKLVTKTMTEIDDWPAYNDAIEVLIDELTTQLGKPDKSWFSSHSKELAVYKKFRVKRALFPTR